MFGIERKRVAVFEKQVEITRAGHKLKHGRIDAFWKGVLLIEHKSLEQDLSRAFAQAADYFEGLPERDLPRYILVSDFARIPLKTSPHIVNGNALTLDWNDVLPAERASYVFGNPPFVGAKFMSDEQREDAQRVFAEIKSGGLLDFVAAWYVKATRYLKASSRDPQGRGDPERGNWIASATLRNDGIRVAFVSTNSITQGEQAGVLWGWLLAQGMHIHFAHRTFQPCRVGTPCPRGC